MARIELDPKQHIELTALRGERHKVYDLGNGQRRMVCHDKPIHYRTGSHWNEVVLDFEQQSEQFLSARNKVSVGFSREGKANKYLGLRYDYDRQLEVSLLDVVLDGESQLSVTDNAFSAVAKDLNNQIVHVLPSGLRILHRVNEVSVVSLLEINDPIEDFEIIEELHLKGIACSNEQKDGNYIPDKRGRFNFVDTKTSETLFWIRPPWFSDAEGTCCTSLEHSLCEDRERLIYTKRPTKQGQDDLVLARYPILVDTNIYYSEASDGCVNLSGADWDTVHDAQTGTVISPASYRNQAIGGYSNALGKGDDLIARSFFVFDTSNLPDAATITGAALKIHGYAQADSSYSVCVQQGTQGDTLANEDYDAFSGLLYGKFEVSSGDGDGLWNVDKYNICNLDGSTDQPGAEPCDDGRLDVSKTGKTYYCCREYTYDYKDVGECGCNFHNGCYYSEEAGTTKDPRLEIDYTVSQTIALDALTLASSVPGLTQASGSVSVACDALTLASSVLSLTWAGVASIVCDALTLVGSAETLEPTGYWTVGTTRVEDGDVIIGLGMVFLDALTLGSSTPTAVVAPGAISVTLNALSLVSTVENLTLVSVVTIAFDALTLAGTAGTLTQSSGAVSIAFDALSLISTLENLTVSVGVSTIALDALTLVGSTPDLTQVSGAVSVAVDTLSLVSSVETLTWAGINLIAIDALTLSSTAENLTLVPGSVSVLIDTLTLGGSALTAAVVPGAVSINADTLTLVGSAEVLVLVPEATSVACGVLSLVGSAETLNVATYQEVLLGVLTLTGAVLNLSAISWWESKVDVALGDTVVTSLSLSDLEVTSLVLVTESRG